MQQFAAGFILALLIFVLFFVFFLYRRTLASRESKSEHLEQLRELGRLSGELAHEIKNPLSTIKINLKLISEELECVGRNKRENYGDSTFTRALKKIMIVRQEVDRLEHILDGFLRYIDRTELQLVNVDVNEIISDMVDFYSPQAVSHLITIREGLFPEPLICKIDVNMLKQAILNLFINAQQAMNNGGELIVKTNKQGNNAEIQIGDTGSGISSDQLAEIFDAYHSFKPRGSGLGLPTARKIVQAHKGTITVDSQVDKGTLFSIKLPLLVNGTVT